jgi:hypothetical protein
MDIVKVQFQSRYNAKEFYGQEYTYYTEIPLKVGDVVKVPTKFGESTAIVSSINVPESQIANIKEHLKTIKADPKCAEFKAKMGARKAAGCENDMIDDLVDELFGDA